MIKVYSTPTCQWCVKAKKYLDSKKVAYESVDVSSDQAGAEEMIKLSGQQGVPVLNMDGRIIIGFDKAAIDEELDKA
ncbi:glutaredoxin domain-containing protein [Clostridium grantii]|uniref:Glutaredoxin-like protein, YruB-family n=1 Tax=Clostridium grantii DSM 8605 TaxID=1121316 RepID=A0A1M5XYK0_9CLOT|nr:glutaredoxin domain-containing protein [Clostridium grantii]SHI04870.1 Glutaredoxin-like protein, YruB-family [Clostridium grantii DSM 8605]